MENLEYYNRSKEPWTETEDEQLRKEYVEDNMDVIEIAYIHKKTPGYIANRLKKINVLEIHLDARGYNEYLVSDLYREIVSSSKKSVNKKESIKEYINVGAPWTPQETADLIKEYNENKLSLLEICRLHKRSPSGIISRLRKYNISNSTKDIRGYSEFKVSDLNKEILSKNTNPTYVKGEVNLVNGNILKREPVNTQSEVDIIKEDIKNIKVALYEIQMTLKTLGKRNLVNTHL